MELFSKFIESLKEHYEMYAAGLAAIPFIIRGLRWVRTEFMELKEVHGKVHRIFEELTPNHGGSIKDKITNIEKQVDEQADATKNIIKRQLWILDNESRMIFETDADGKFLWVNKSFKDVTNRELSYFKGFGWKNIIADEDRERVVEKWNSCLQDGIIYEDTFKIVSDTGEQFAVKCIANKADKCGYMGTLLLIDSDK